MKEEKFYNLRAKCGGLGGFVFRQTWDRFQWPEQLFHEDLVIKIFLLWSIIIPPAYEVLGGI